MIVTCKLHTGGCWSSVCFTYHLLHQILHDQPLLSCADISYPHPAILQVIVNNKHVPFQEAEGTRQNIMTQLSSGPVKNMS